MAVRDAETTGHLVRYRIVGMDCPDDVAMIEKAARTVTGVTNAQVSLASQTLTVRLGDGLAPLSAVEQAVGGLGFQVDRLDGESRGRTHITTSYKRALTCCGSSSIVGASRW